MRKQILYLVLLASMALSACVSKTTPISEPTSQPTQAAPVPTVKFEVPQSSDLTGPDSGCTVVARQPTPGPTQMSLYPPITEDDHVKGPETAKITIIEYSDFQ